MIPTVELYYENPDIREFDAKVLHVEKRDNRLEIILNATAFFPEAGGQVCDQGTLSGLNVLHVRKEGDIVIHEVETSENEICAGDTLHGVIDDEFHFFNMQHHTAEHIMSGLVHRLYGYDNVGFHLSENTCTMDFNGPLTDKDIEKIELLTNEIIHKDIPVKIYYPSKEELDNIEYRAKLEAEDMGQVRLVEIEGVDICACCAPHLPSTGQIGVAKVVEHIKYKGGVRITIVSGTRALSDYKKKFNDILSLSHILSVPSDSVVLGVEKIKEEISSLKETIRILEEKIITASVCSAKYENNKCIIFTDISDKILLRNTANSLMESEPYDILIFNGNDTKGYSFIIGSKKDDAVDILHRLSEIIDIKGGGKNPMVQGSCSLSSEEIKTAISKF